MFVVPVVFAFKEAFPTATLLDAVVFTIKTRISNSCIISSCGISPQSISQPIAVL